MTHAKASSSRSSNHGRPEGARGGSTYRESQVRVAGRRSPLIGAAYDLGQRNRVTATL